MLLSFFLNLFSWQDYGVLVIPTVTGPPPKLHMKSQELNDFRANAFRLICIAGLSGICQVFITIDLCSL